MKKPLPPKRYTINDKPNKSAWPISVKYDSRGKYMLANEAIEYGDKMFDAALELAADLLDNYVVDINVPGGKLRPVTVVLAGTRDTVRACFSEAIRAGKKNHDEVA